MRIGCILFMLFMNLNQVSILSYRAASYTVTCVASIFLYKRSLNSVVRISSITSNKINMFLCNHDQEILPIWKTWTCSLVTQLKSGIILHCKFNIRFIALLLVVVWCVIRGCKTIPGDFNISGSVLWLFCFSLNTLISTLLSDYINFSFLESHD